MIAINGNATHVRYPYLAMSFHKGMVRTKISDAGFDMRIPMASTRRGISSRPTNKPHTIQRHFISYQLIYITSPNYG